MQAAIPDILRLVAVPVLGWAAVQDLRTRRVTNEIWWPLVALGLVLIAWEGYQLSTAQFGFRLYLLRVALSLGIVIPLAYAFWYLGGFGGADAKAFMVLAVLFPTFPSFHALGVALPLIPTRIGVFSLSILTNTVLVGLVFPVALGVRNLLTGQFSIVMFLGHRVPVAELPGRHGTLLETDEGFTRRGLDLDALRMYLRWRGIDLKTLRSNPELVDPSTLPDEPGDPTDGAVLPDGGSSDGGDSEEGRWVDADEPAAESSASEAETSAPERSERDDSPPDPTTDQASDRWGAEAFLEDIDSTAYGTTPEKLRTGLDVVTAQDAVWVSPGIPFIMPTFVGLLVALTAGDILFWVLGLVGLVG